MAEPEFTEPRGASLTQSADGKRLYLCLCEYPFKQIKLSSLAGKIRYAQFLNDASEVTYSEKFDTGEVIFSLPIISPQEITPVIEIFLN